MSTDTETKILTTFAGSQDASNPTLSIRRATPGDNEKLIDLARRCPMKGQLEMYSDRYPDFFATNRVQGDISHIYLVETDDGRVVGCGAFTEKKERRGDKDITVLHIGDMRSDPSMRRGKIAASMVKIYFDMIKEGPYDHGIVEILEGNRPALALNDLRPKEVELVHEGRMNFFQLVPFRNYRVSSKWSYRKARTEDLPEIVAIFTEAYGDAPGAPHFTVEWLERELSRDKSFTIDDLWVAVNAEGRVVASMGLWDQSSFRRTVATKFTRGIKNVVRALAMLGIVWKLPPLPREGEALQYVFGRWPVARISEVEALASLCRYILNNVYKGRKHQFLSIGFFENDPLEASLDGMTKVQEKIEVFTHWVRDSEQFQEVQKNPSKKRFMDLSLI